MEIQINFDLAKRIDFAYANKKKRLKPGFGWWI
jgi:hypothetical protein